MRNSEKLTAAVLTLSLFGVGCTQPKTSLTQPSTQKPQATQTQAVANKLGFGKLPKIEQAATSSGQDVTAMAKTNIPGELSGTGVTAASKTDQPKAAAGTSAQGMVATPTIEPGAIVSSAPGVAYKEIMPSPPVRRLPVSVEYQINAALPNWQSEDAVLKIDKRLPDANTVSALARTIGLPAKAMTTDSSVTGLNFQWRDKDKLAWSLDVGSRYLSFWQEADYMKPMPAIYEEPDYGKIINYNKADMISAADAFLDAHGFTSIRMTGGKNQEVQDEGWPVSPMGTDYRCAAAETVSVSNSKITSAIYPPTRCFPWSENVTVVYGSLKQGRQTVDQYGNITNVAYVNINIRDKKITGGSIQLDQDALRSIYPLISAETAKKRLAAGGLNPVYPWGTENGSIKVTITNISLVWLKYDTWSTNENITYLLPALLATGSVERGKGTEPENYLTTLPLVDDSAFEVIYAEPTPVPMPLEVTPPVQSSTDVQMKKTQ